jgi:putative ATP-dependent endonuclease of the OLD family
VRVRRITIENFRGIARGVVEFPGHTLLVGGNNVGKSTVCEALDLVLGTERLFRRPIVDEHDFHNGQYFDGVGNVVVIKIEAVLIDLPEEVRRG